MSRRTPVFSFRLKLLLAMMTLVAGVSLTTLVVTQQRVRAAYQQVAEEQFMAQLNFFSERQADQIEALREKCLALTRSVRLRAAMEAGQNDADVDVDFLDQNVREEVFRPGAELVSDASSSFLLCFLDARGQVLRSSIGRGPFRFSSKGDQQLAVIGKAMPALELQEFGYLASESDDGQTSLQQVIVTRIVDSLADRTLGALVVGFPLSERGERALKDISQIRSGIWFDGRIYSQSIPEGLHEPLGELVANEIRQFSQPRADLEVEFGGRTYRIFYQALNPGSSFPPAYQVGIYSLEQLGLQQAALRWRIIGFSAVAVMGALLLSLLLAHGLSVPLRELVGGTDQIKQGNFAIKVPVRSRDELGQLAESFNEMAAGLALKDKYHNLLNQVADKEVARQLLSGEVALGGVVREVSVLFCDIRGFTARTQNMPPDEVILMLNDHMTALTRIVYQHHGVVDKFVGDLIMAIFGAPKSYGADAAHAAACALEMIRERARLNETSNPRIEMGIGLATGPVVAGCMGSSDRLNYTVLGERVNLAARLCSQAGPGEVVIDQTTREQLGESAQGEELPPVRLKGFSDPIVAFKLRGWREGADEI